MSDPLSDLLDRQGVAILDGGLATELEARGHEIGDALWSARLLIDDPESLRQVHRDYLLAGADCIVSASYQASFAGFRRRGLSEGEATRLLRRSVELARQARDELWPAPEQRPGRRRPLVAAGIGPYGAFLADGSEYTGIYDLDAEGLTRFHRRRLQVLATSGADLLACETIPSAVEARVLVELLESVPGPAAWISFSCRDARRLSDGSELAVIAAEVAASPRVVAVGVNCTAPRHVAPLLAALRRETAKPLVAYPNSGERYDAGLGRWLPADPAVDLAEAAVGWVELGARLVGGCCRTRPDDIRRLRRRLTAIRALRVLTETG